jgi:hypothetical protein
MAISLLLVCAITFQYEKHLRRPGRGGEAKHLSPPQLLKINIKQKEMYKILIQIKKNILLC